jgi:hypothetical protein
MPKYRDDMLKRVEPLVKGGNYRGLMTSLNWYTDYVFHGLLEIARKGSMNIHDKGAVSTWKEILRRLPPDYRNEALGRVADVYNSSLDTLGQRAAGVATSLLYSVVSVFDPYWTLSDASAKKIKADARRIKRLSGILGLEDSRSSGTQ